MAKPFPGYIMEQNGPQNVPKDVGDVQDVLSVQRTEVYGPTTEENVTKFQRSQGIGQTGKVGQETWNALFDNPPPPPALGVNAAGWALGEVGTAEVPLGSNWGPRVKEYLASVDIDYPAFWCLAFAFWCVGKEAAGRGVANPLLKTASCSAFYNWAKENGRLVTAPKKGDIFLCIGGGSGHYHCGFVTEDPKNGYFVTVEGNSNNDGSANGVAVVQRRPGRRIGSCDYVRV